MADSEDQKTLFGLPFQFSLKALLITITVVAVLFGFYAMWPRLLWYFLTSVFMPALIVVVLYGRGKYQAAALGSLLTFVSGHLVFSLSSHMLYWLGLSVLGGLVSFWTYIWIKQQGWDRPK